MHLLHVHSGNLFGGVESMLLALKRAEPSDLMQSYALCWEGRLSDELRALGAHTIPMPDVRLRSPTKVLRARRALARILEKDRPDVVLLHSAWSQLIFAATVARAKVPLARYVHGIPSRTEWMDRLAMRWRPSLIVCAGNFTGDIAARVYPQCKRAVVCYPVDVDSFERDQEARSRVRASFGMDNDTVVVLQASRMEPWKGQALHLEALARIKTTRRWEAWFVGGAQREEEVAFANSLAKQARRLGISEKIRFLGQRPDIPALLSAADIFCQPNEGPEPFGIVFVEALAAGLPVVTTNMGGGADILSDGYGCLVDVDATKLAATLGSLIDSDPLRASLGVIGPGRARELCDPQRQAALLATTLDGCRSSLGTDSSRC